MRVAVGAVAALAVFLAVASTARADKVEDLIDQLRGDPDYKVRLSAALALGKLADRRAVSAFVDGLSDPDKSVRLVAAGALGKIVDKGVPEADRARVQGALAEVARGDGEPSVRAQAEKSLAALRSLAPATGARAVYVEVGNMADKTTRGGAVIPVMQRSVISSLQRRAPTFLVHYAGGRAQEVDFKRAGTTAFFVDASLTRLDATGSHVACAVSMILATYPQKSMFGFLNGSAEVDAGSTSERAVSEAVGDCVSAVTEDLVNTKIVPTIQSRAP